MSRRLRIACVGDNCIDRYLPPLNYALVGGNAVNVAVQLTRIGVASAYFGAAGQDAGGERLRAALLGAGVSVAGLRLRAGETTATTDIATTPDGERQFLHEDFGACATYRPDEHDLAALAAFDHVHLGWLNDGGALKRYLRRHGVSVSQDLSVNAAPDNLSPAGLSVAFASASGDAAEALAEALLEGGAVLAVVTSGAAGSLAATGQQIVRAAALTLEPVDTTGAGDSFIAGFLASYLNGAPLPEALAQGAIRASEACRHHGGFRQPLLAISDL